MDCGFKRECLRMPIFAKYMWNLTVIYDSYALRALGESSRITVVIMSSRGYDGELILMNDLRRRL